MGRDYRKEADSGDHEDDYGYYAPSFVYAMLDDIDRLRARVKELEKDGEDYRSYIDTLMGQRGG